MHSLTIQAIGRGESWIISLFVPQNENNVTSLVKGVGAIRLLFGPKITANLKVFIHILKFLKSISGRRYSEKQNNFGH